MKKRKLTKSDIDNILEVVVSAEDKDFFSNSFTEKNFIKDMIAYRFSYGEPNWLNRLNEGRLYIREDIDSKKIQNVSYFENWCRKNDIAESNIIAYYIEKMRKKKCCFIVDDGRIYADNVLLDVERLVVHDINGISEDNENFYDICVSVSFKCFLDNLMMLRDYKYNITYFNPVSKKSFMERENYIEYILAFFIEYGGLNAKQIFHITDMFRNFEISSQKAAKIITILFQYRHCCLSKATDEIFNLLDKTDVHTLLIDILYLIHIGEYDCMQIYNMQKDICKSLKVSMERVVTIKKQIEKELC